MRGGIDVGGTKIQAIVVADERDVVGQARRSTPLHGGPRAVLAETVVALHEAARAAGVEASSLEGVGVGTPGAVDARAGTVAHAGNLPEWEEPFPLAAALEDALGTHVKLGNDVGVALEAEAALGGARAYRTFLGLWWGTGVGGGIVRNGKRWLGRGGGGEVGHMVVKLGGPRCPCGRRGCLEALAGRNALERRVRRAQRRGVTTRLFRIMEKKGHTRLTSGVWQEALERGDELAAALIENAIEALGAGAASVVNLLDVEAVIVGGGLGTRLGEAAVERIKLAMQPHLFRPDVPPDVQLASLGDLGGAIGAARLISPRPPRRK